MRGAIAWKGWLLYVWYNKLYMKSLHLYLLWSCLNGLCIVHPVFVLTLLLSGTRSSLMRRFVPQSFASSSSAISCRWKTATWADRRLTLPLGVLSKSSPWLSVCAAFCWCGSLSLFFSLASLSLSLGWLDGPLSCHSFLSVWLCSFLPPDGHSSEITCKHSKTFEWKYKKHFTYLFNS